MSLYTVTAEYFATGEGVTRAAWIGHAKDKIDAELAFRNKFGSRLYLVCEVFEGFQIDNIVESLFSEAAIKIVKDNQYDTVIELCAELYFNAS